MKNRLMISDKKIQFKSFVIVLISILNCLMLTACGSIIITYNLNYEGSINIEKEYSKNAIVDIDDPHRDGYKFLYWSNDKDGNEEFNKSSVINSNITLYAIWERNVKSFIIYFDCDGGSINNKPIYTMYFDEDNKISLPKPERSGYDFLGWYETTDIYYKDEITYLNNHDYQVIAKWEKVFKVDVISEAKDYSNAKYYDITYKIVNNTALKMDISFPYLNPNEKHPVLFFFYGGGWVTGDKKDIKMFSSITDKLLSEGFIIVAVNYRLANKTTGVKYPDPVMDIMDSIRYIVKYKDQLRADVDNMGAIGYSAGGYFALMSAFAQDYYYEAAELKDYKFKLKFVCDLFGPAVFDTDTIPNLSLASKAMLQAFLATTDFSNSELASCFPSYYINNNKPNVLIVHGEEDSIVPIEQSKMLESMMKELGMKVETCYVEGAEHTLTPASGFNYINPSYQNILNLIYDFIIKQK